MNTFEKMPGKEKKISRKENTTSELQQSLMEIQEIKMQMDKFNEMFNSHLPAMQEKIDQKIDQNAMHTQKKIDQKIDQNFDSLSDSLSVMQEKIGSSFQKQIDSIVSHLVNMKKELQEKVEMIETQYEVTNAAFEEPPISEYPPKEKLKNPSWGLLRLPSEYSWTLENLFHQMF